MLSLVRGERRFGPSRVDLSVTCPCVMCSTPTSRGELVRIDGQNHEVGWCLSCWLRHGDGVPLAAVPHLGVAS